MDHSGKMFTSLFVLVFWRYSVLLKQEQPEKSVLKSLTVAFTQLHSLFLFFLEVQETFKKYIRKTHSKTTLGGWKEESVRLHLHQDDVSLTATLVV